MISQQGFAIRIHSAKKLVEHQGIFTWLYLPPLVSKVPANPGPEATDSFANSRNPIEIRGLWCVHDRGGDGTWLWHTPGAAKLKSRPVSSTRYSRSTAGWRSSMSGHWRCRGMDQRYRVGTLKLNSAIKGSIHRRKWSEASQGSPFKRTRGMYSCIMLQRFSNGNVLAFTCCGLSALPRGIITCTDLAFESGRFLRIGSSFLLCHTLWIYLVLFFVEFFSVFNADSPLTRQGVHIAHDQHVPFPSSGCEEYLSKGGAWQHQLSCSIVPQFVPICTNDIQYYMHVSCYLFCEIIFTRFYLIHHPFAPASDKICDLRSGCHCEVQVLGWWPRCSSGKSEVSWKSWMSPRDERWSDWNGCFIFALLIARSCRFIFFIFVSRWRGLPFLRLAFVGRTQTSPQLSVIFAAVVSANILKLGNLLATKWYTMYRGGASMGF